MNKFQKHIEWILGNEGFEVYQLGSETLYTEKDSSLLEMVDAAVLAVSQGDYNACRETGVTGESIADMTGGAYYLFVFVEHDLIKEAVEKLGHEKVFDSIKSEKGLVSIPLKIDGEGWNPIVYRQPKPEYTNYRDGFRKAWEDCFSNSLTTLRELLMGI